MVRKHLSRAKGGWLARLASPATVVSLILSDVVGDNLDAIASGPTVPDSSTFPDAEQVLKGYEIWDQLAPSVRTHISGGVRGEIKDTPKSEDTAFEQCFTIMVGTNLQALEAAKKEIEPSLQPKTNELKRHSQSANSKFLTSVFFQILR